MAEEPKTTLEQVITSNEQQPTEEKKPEQAPVPEVKPEATEVKPEQTEQKTEIKEQVIEAKLEPSEEKKGEEGPKKLENTQENKDLSMYISNNFIKYSFQKNSRSIQCFRKI